MMNLQIRDNTPRRNQQYRAMKKLMTGIIFAWLASAGFVFAGSNDITTLVQKGLFEQEANHHLDAAIDNYKEAIGNFDRDRQLAATAIFQLGECYRLQGKTNEANAQYERVVREFADQAQLVELSQSYLPKSGCQISVNQNLTSISEGNEAPTPDEQLEIQKINDMIQNSPDLINAHVQGAVGTPLVVAACSGWMSAAKLLVDHGAVVNPEQPQSFTPLTAAAQAGNKGMIDFLLSKRADINALDVTTWMTWLGSFGLCHR